MVEYYKNRLKKKSKEELEHIVQSHHGYERAAVKASIILLKEEHGISLPLPFEENSSITHQEDIYTYKKYFKTFSYREITSAVVLSFLFFAVSNAISYLGTVPLVEVTRPWIMFFLIFLICVLNHSIYKKEHRRRNLFLGRILQDILTIFMFLVLWTSMNWFLGNSKSPDSGAIASVVLVVIFGLLFIEAIVSILRRILTLFGWHIW